MIFLSFFKYIVIDLNDVPLNINAMQKAERNMVGLDCLHEFVIIAVAKCIRKEDNPFWYCNRWNRNCDGLLGNGCASRSDK